MRNKKRNRIFLLLILLLGLGIGFAALATTLKINGTTIINKNTWNIYWDNIDNETGVTPTSISIDDEDENHLDNIVSFNVTFDKPGDYFEFTVDAVNAGTLDAEVLSIVKKYNDTVIPEVEDPENRVVPAYLKYEVTYADDTAVNVGDKLLKAPDLTSNPQVLTRKTYKVRVEYDRDAVTNEDVNNQTDTVYHSFTLSVQYGQATPVVAPVAFATDDWDVIATEGNSAALQETTDGSCGVYNVGDTKTIDMGSLGTQTVRIANCSTPSACSTTGFSQSACGFVVEFAGNISEHRINFYEGSASVNGTGNKGGWEYSDMRAYLNGTTYAYENINYASNSVFSKLPSDLKSQIKTTTIVSGHGAGDSSNFVTDDKLYLLSAKEVWGKEGTSAIVAFDTGEEETRQLDYYHGIGVTTNNYEGAKKELNGAVSSTWTRTPNASTTYSNRSFYGINDYGSWVNEYASTAIGVSPAFKLK